MIELVDKKGYYASRPLVTLEEAKKMYQYLRYLDWLDNNTLGYVEFPKRHLDNEVFIPVSYNGKTLIPKQKEI